MTTSIQVGDSRTLHLHNLAQPGHAAAAMRAKDLQNAARALERQGDREAALAKYREALQAKIATHGEHSINVGITLDSMGVCLIEMNRLEEAEAVLRRAQVIRDDLDRGLDAAVTRDNLGRALEMQGKLADAKAARRGVEQTEAVWYNYACPRLNDLFKYRDLDACPCQAVFYHSKGCQRADWRRHKQFCSARKKA